MKTLGVILARGGSKRLPGKNIMPFCGRPLIAWTIQAAQRSKLDTVAVSTDSEDIVLAAKAHYCEVIRRPAEFATDVSPFEDALRHAVKECMPDAGIVVCMQANVPIRRDGDIDSVVEICSREGVTAAATAIPIETHPAWAKQLIDGFAIPFMEGIVSFRRQELEPLYFIDGAAMAVRTDTLLATEGLSGPHLWMGNRVKLFVHEKIYGLDIDEPGDVPLAQAAMEKANEARHKS